HRLRGRGPSARLGHRPGDRHEAGHRAARSRAFLRLRHAVLGSALRLRAHLVTRLVDASFDSIERVYESLIADGKKALAASGVRAEGVAAARAADMRYVGQEHPVTVDLPAEVFRRRSGDALKRRFDEEHLRRYGTCAPEEAAEIVSLRATVTGALKKPRLERIARGGRSPLSSAHRGKRKVYFAELGRPHATPSYAREGLK